MAHSEKASLVLSALVIAGLVGCGGSDQNTQPQTPASTDTTMTTGAQTPGTPAPSEQGQYGAANPSTYNQSGAEKAAPSQSPSQTSTGTWGANPSANPSGAAAGTAPDTSSNAITDDQIAAVTSNANSGEVDQAKEITKKTKNGKVRTFAQHMITDHGANYKAQLELEKKFNITPKENEISRQVQSDGKTILTSLQAATGADADKQYIEAQIREHQTLLDTLDNKLIPNAKNGDLKAFLQKTRDKVADHLKMAKDVQATLK